MKAFNRGIRNKLIMLHRGKAVSSEVVILNIYFTLLPSPKAPFEKTQEWPF